MLERFDSFTTCALLDNSLCTAHYIISNSTSANRLELSISLRCNGEPMQRGGGEPSGGRKRRSLGRSPKVRTRF